MAFVKKKYEELSPDEAKGFSRPASQREPVNLEVGEVLTDVFIKEYIRYERDVELSDGPAHTVFHGFIVVSGDEEGILSGGEQTAFGRDLARIGAALNGCTVDLAKVAGSGREGRTFHSLTYKVKSGTPGKIGPLLPPTPKKDDSEELH